MLVRPRLRVTGLANLLALTALSVGSVARADQLVVLDETWVHTPDLPDSHFRVDPSPATPADWVSPVDYSQGTAYVYLEVHTKPTAQETRFQVCFEATPTYACTDQSPTYTAPGTYEWSTPFSAFYVPEGTSVDWAQGVNKLACILKDTENNKPSADNVGDEVAALYTPTEVRMVVTIVTPGGAYEPPTPTGEGGAGAGGEGGSGSTSSSSASTSSGAATSTSAASGGSSTTASSTSSAANGASTGAGGDPGAGGGGASSASPDDDGCSVGEPSRGASWAVPTLIAAAALGRRRRERAARARPR